MANALRRSNGTSSRTAVKDGEVIKTLIDSFQYPRKGPGMMWEAAAAKVKRAGRRRSTWATRSRSCRGTSKQRRVDDHGVDGGRRAHGFTARHVISSAPIRELMHAITPRARSLRRGREAALPRFPHRRADRRQADLFPDNWIYIHEPSVKVGRIQNFKSWSPEMVPDEKSSCFGLEYFCFEGDGLWTRPTRS